MKPAVFLAVAMFLPAAHATNLTISGYSSSVNSAAQTATFTIDYLVQPHFYQVNRYGNVADSFAIWIDPNAPDAYERAQSHYFGELPDSKQTFITADTIVQTGQLQASWVVDSTSYVGLYGVGGWGPEESSFGYSLQHKVMSFVVPLSTLQVSGSNFYYDLMITNYGSSDGGPFEGVSGQSYSAPFPIAAVPEPSTWALALGGLLALGITSRRRRIAKQAP